MKSHVTVPRAPRCCLPAVRSHRHAVSGGQSKERAVFIVHAQEHAWHQRCDRWQQAEHRDSSP